MGEEGPVSVQQTHKSADVLAHSDADLASARALRNPYPKVVVEGKVPMRSS